MFKARVGSRAGTTVPQGAVCELPSPHRATVEPVRMESGSATEWISGATGFPLPEARPC